MTSPRAMVLAAGLGTRLRPLTEMAPKPLLPVAGRPLLANVIAGLRAAGVREIAVNTHHLPEQIEEFAAGEEGLTLFHEPQILGTGGALVGAGDFLSASDFFLLHNGDVLTDFDPGELIAAQEGSGALGTLVLTPGHENKVLVSGEGTILDILGKVDVGGQPGSRLLTYTGIAALSPRIFEYLPAGGPASLPAALIAALEAEPGCLRAVVPGAMYWNDIGTAERYLAAQADVLARGSVALRGEAGVPQSLVEQGSDRLFYRLKVGAGTAVVMLSDPADPDLGRYLEIGRFLHERGLGVPEILAASEDDGAILLEDLGDGTLFGTAPDARDAGRLEEIYAQVVDFLAELGARAKDDPEQCPADDGRALHHEQLRWESGYFLENFLERMLGFSAAET
ncbi:MAG: sugar phosphate nucleotidyltransferase, partial [Planctomycetota bacterium]